MRHDEKKKTRIPHYVPFRTKTDLAMDMILRAVDNGIPGDVVLADSFYGRSHHFRDMVRDLGLDYAVAIDADTSIQLLDRIDRIKGESVLVSDFAFKLGSKAFRRLTWRQGTRRLMSGRFCFRRIKFATDERIANKDREPVWLVLEWPEGEAKPTKFFVTTLPRRLSKKQIVRIIKERWRTERAYEDLKGELGLDHYEGRSFSGWHHHISVVLCCYAFVIAERVRHFPPSRGRPNRRLPLDRAA